MGKVPRDGPGRKGGASAGPRGGAHSGHLLGEEPVTSTRGWSGTERGHACEWEEVKSSGDPPHRGCVQTWDPPPIPPHHSSACPLQTPAPQAWLPPTPAPSPPLHPLGLVLMLPLQSCLPALPEAAALAAAPPPGPLPRACETLSPASGVSSPSG